MSGAIIQVIFFKFTIGAVHPWNDQGMESIVWYMKENHVYSHILAPSSSA